MVRFGVLMWIVTPLFLDSSGRSCNLRPGTIKLEGEKAPANLLPASGAVFCVTEVRL